MILVKPDIKPTMSGIGSLAYRFVTRRFSTLLIASTAGAFTLNYTLNKATDLYWDTVNKGKQWKEVKLTIQ
ncbi:hypothetical protein PRIPAC_94534 [Pristionchus pacificus]|uniref:Complex III subunit 9 n=1 Tax=Pristionchus pacificus TaxID=54126 RepID=A0A2A6BP08_PRIPA|nr:hypothetical protein PRIPAC_94534 [Pristionchus pacificus]|eukprot:PDM67639.1 hypothetical protein PRIPAC_45683 [Pristionchus pacificus]